MKDHFTPQTSYCISETSHSVSGVSQCKMNFWIIELWHKRGLGEKTWKKFSVTCPLKKLYALRMFNLKIPQILKKVGVIKVVIHSFIVNSLNKYIFSFCYMLNTSGTVLGTRKKILKRKEKTRALDSVVQLTGHCPGNRKVAS